MNVGAAIVTHNNKEDIGGCIASIVREGAEQIAIVDSASSDGTAEAVAGLSYPYELLRDNKGFGYAANRAARLLNTEYVLFLNPDAALSPGSLSHAMRAMRASSRVGIVGLLLQDARGVPERAAYGSEPTLPRLVLRHIFRPAPLRRPRRVGWVSGGAMLVSREAFTALQGFDESFFLYWEDVDICRRMREAGYGVIIDPQAAVVHRRGGSNLGEREKIAIYNASADKYYKKHYPTAIWMLHRVLRKIYRG